MQNLVQVAPVLQDLRGIWRTPENRQGDVPLSMTLGLYQGDKLDAAARLVHQRALNEAFLPQLAKRIEDQLRTAQKDNLEFTYEALKVYLMLHQPEHFDPEALKAWITLDWARSLDRGIPEDQRKLLEDQLDVLIAQGPPRSPLKMDENLVRSVRAVLASYPLEQRVFSRLKRQRIGQGHPGLQRGRRGRPFGAAGVRAHQRQAADRGRAGPVHLRRLPQALPDRSRGADRPARQAKSRGCWARSAAPPTRLRDAAGARRADRPRAPPLPRGIRQGVGSAARPTCALVRASGLEKSIETARILSGAGSPLASLLRAVVKETTLIPPETGQGRGEQGQPRRCAARARAWKTCSAATPDKAGGHRASASRASSTTASSRCAGW